jgi:nitrogen regulatory protein PII
MIRDLNVIKISGIFHRDLTSTITAALESAGINTYQITAGRSINLREKKRELGIGAPVKVVDIPVDLVSILVTPELEQDTLRIIVNSGGLATPGRGSVYSENTVIRAAHDLCRPNTSVISSDADPIKLQHEITGICCIVQRGEGNEVARLALDTGTCVPVITYGHGTGVRDKLGLLRITIPAEKEIITVMTSSYDSDVIMNLMIAKAKLNLPGKGFIFMFPIRYGQINMKVIQGMPKHAASIEQMIVAIDEMRGSSAWRARGPSFGAASLKRRDYLHDLVILTYTCNEGGGEKMIREAMNNGVPGATMTRSRYACPADSEARSISPAREVCKMVIAESQVGEVIEAMERQGALDDDRHGQFCLNRVPKAYTYTIKK